MKLKPRSGKKLKKLSWHKKLLIGLVSIKAIVCKSTIAFFISLFLLLKKIT
jgi:hypothetical protein